VSITIRETTITVDVDHDCAENEGASGRSINNDLLIWEVAGVVNIRFCPYCGDRLPETVAAARKWSRWDSDQDFPSLD